MIALEYTITEYDVVSYLPLIACPILRINLESIKLIKEKSGNLVFMKMWEPFLLLDNVLNIYMWCGTVLCIVLVDI